MHSLRPNLAVPKLGEAGGLSRRRCSRDLCAARDRLADGGLSEADVAGEGGLGEEAEADAGGCHFLRWRAGGWCRGWSFDVMRLRERVRAKGGIGGLCSFWVGWMCLEVRRWLLSCGSEDGGQHLLVYMSELRASGGWVVPVSS